MRLDQVIERHNNNLDIFRVLCAALVVYGHSFAMFPDVLKTDVVTRWVGFTFSGALAVKVFFFISGLVVTNSLLTKNDPVVFVLSRIFRIWPALAFVLVMSAYVIGPIFTTLDMATYLQQPEVFSYVARGLKLTTEYYLPGVISGSGSVVINGALWSIYYEVAAYVVLLTLFLLGVLKSPIVSLILFIAVVVDSVLSEKFLFVNIWNNPEVTQLAPCFAVGVLAALFKQRIPINFHVALGFVLLYGLFRKHTYNYYFFYLCVFYVVVYLSSLDVFLRIKSRTDISYGMYLWGWPVQKIVFVYLSSYGLLANQVVSVVLTAVMGFVSWHLIEKQGIRWGSALSLRWTRGTQRTQLESDPN